MLPVQWSKEQKSKREKYFLECLKLKQNEKKLIRCYVWYQFEKNLRILILISIRVAVFYDERKIEYKIKPISCNGYWQNTSQILIDDQ